MSKTNSKSIRENASLARMKAWGPGVYNPLIGSTIDETCSNLSDVLGFITLLMDDEDNNFDELRPGLEILVRTAWAATQHEQAVAEFVEKEP
jgi:hypothetical protein